MRQGSKTTNVAISLLLISSLLIQGCGQNEAVENSAGSFSAVTPAVTVTKSVIVMEKETEAKTVATTVEAPSELMDRDTTEQDQEKNLDQSDKIETEAVEEKEPKEPKKIVDDAKNNKKLSKQEAEVKEVENTISSDQPNSVQSQPQPISKSTPIKKLKQNEKGITSISWSGFFDDEDQTTPSDQFWDLSGSTVKIKGFMGEVLSFEKNWFLLIPEPGAECPFDNGDETYWNKIMIVFVPEDVKLRYNAEPIELTGRLDVGIKVDESGYKTMFRLYDATFKEIKE